MVTVPFVTADVVVPELPPPLQAARVSAAAIPAASHAPEVVLRLMIHIPGSSQNPAAEPALRGLAVLCRVPSESRQLIWLPDAHSYLCSGSTRIPSFARSATTVGER